MKRFIQYTIGLVIILVAFSCDNLDISPSQANSFIKLYGSSSSDIGIDVKGFNNGYVLLATTTHAERIDTDIAILITDKYGNQIGETLFIDGGGDDMAGSLLLTDDGGFIVVGTYTDTANNNQDIYLAKYNLEGEFDWEKLISTEEYEQNSNEVGNVISKAKNGYIIAGSIAISGFTRDIYLVKIDEAGNIDWEIREGWENDDYASDVIMYNEGYAIIGSTNGYEADGLGGYDMLLVTFGFDGGLTNTNVYGGLFNDFGHSMVSTSDGFVFTGSQEFINGANGEIYISKVDKNSLLENMTPVSFGDNLYDRGLDITKNEEGYTVVGNFEISNGTTAAYFLQTDTEGNELTENIYGSYNQTFNSVERTPDGGYIMIGNSGQEGNEMIFLMKLDYYSEL